MKSSGVLRSNLPDLFRLSKCWDVFIPLIVAAVPAGAFLLLGFVTSGLDKPGANPDAGIILTMIGLQTLGTVGMALVILLRFDFGRNQLGIRTKNNPPVWRKIFLLLSYGFLLLFDILTNVASAFSGAGVLVVFAAAAFGLYLLCIKFTFVRL